MKLLGSHGSPYARKARIAMLEKNVPCEFVPARAADPGSLVPQYNPLSKVPVLVLDDERCVLCTRCIRFTKDIAGDDALGIVNRGSYNTIAAWAEGAFDNNYTLNTVDICPVGALTSKDFRFQMRVWFMKETKSLCTSCGTGCNIVVGSREERVYRYEPRQNDAVNSTWMCDSGRLNYKWIGREDRLKKCGMRIAERGMIDVAWPTALKAISAKLASAATDSVAVIATVAGGSSSKRWMAMDAPVY